MPVGLCADLYSANVCGDRQLSVVVRIVVLNLSVRVAVPDALGISLISYHPVLGVLGAPRNRQ